VSGKSRTDLEESRKNGTRPGRKPEKDLEGNLKKWNRPKLDQARNLKIIEDIG
jgi:hypothetical protein